MSRFILIRRKTMYSIFEKLCKEHNIKPTQLAKTLGISPSIISYWKTGKRSPSFKTLTLVAEYFGVSIDYLNGKDTKLNVETSSGAKDAAIISNKQFMKLVYKIYELNTEDQKRIDEYVQLPPNDKKTIDDLIHLLSSKLPLTVKIKNDNQSE